MFFLNRSVEDFSYDSSTDEVYAEESDDSTKIVVIASSVVVGSMVLLVIVTETYYRFKSRTNKTRYEVVKETINGH